MHTNTEREKMFIYTLIYRQGLSKLIYRWLETKFFKQASSSTRGVSLVLGVLRLRVGGGARLLDGQLPGRWQGAGGLDAQGPVGQQHGAHRVGLHILGQGHGVRELAHVRRTALLDFGAGAHGELVARQGDLDVFGPVLTHVQLYLELLAGSGLDGHVARTQPAECRPEHARAVQVAEGARHLVLEMPQLPVHLAEGVADGERVASPHVSPRARHHGAPARHRQLRKHRSSHVSFRAQTMR